MNILTDATRASSTDEHPILTAIREHREPMTTAPRDGQFIDIWHSELGRLADCRWGIVAGEPGWYRQSGGYAWLIRDAHRLTHWAPVFEPFRGFSAD